MTDSGRQSAIDGVEIDLGRLRADIEAVNRIGTIEGLPGINRVSFSDADMAGRRWLMQRMEAAGLSARMDAVGNVFGRWEAREGPAVLAGSHLDSVPMGGPFDGALGVLAALEGVRAMQEAGISPARPVEVVCTADEEGRFGGMLGSQAICGAATQEWVATAADEDGIGLAEAMRAQGLDPEAVESAARDPGDIAAFLELHVEQGPILERAGEAIGVVDVISGVFNWTVTLSGEANHSGSTPMDMRRDAFRGMAAFGAAIDGILTRAGTPEAKLTVGKAGLRPNFPHTIAGEAEFSIIGRDVEDEAMRALADGCRAEIEAAAEAHGLGVSIREQSWLAPVALDSGLAEMLREEAGRLGYAHRTMPSGGGHDAQTFAGVTRSGLIFVPSVRGISHAPEEWTDWADVARGATLLARAIARLAS
jgi:N-carbamoyl-L-amino-acid hydrolase